MYINVHDIVSWKERKKPKANEKMKNELPQVVFEPTTHVHVIQYCVDVNIGIFFQDIITCTYLIYNFFNYRRCV